MKSKCYVYFSIHSRDFTFFNTQVIIII